ncbi:hypothetical protein [Hyphomicrobium sp.]|uniref:hypothetical protein n=1 Tax=Hyphomicrobium sp. TaxID=82 RepID=UPI0025B98607|nr:hypothetical protein [Hyphomicrobium sp.]MCC7252134.1 hypothetical protein [Hyphomicrobium sp.]
MLQRLSSPINAVYGHHQAARADAIAVVALDIDDVARIPTSGCSRSKATDTSSPLAQPHDYRHCRL